MQNSVDELELASKRVENFPSSSGRGVIVTAGGPYLPGAYVVVKMLRFHGCQLPVEIWHAGPSELAPLKVVDAFGGLGVSFHDITKICPDRDPKPLRGFPIKPAALKHTTLSEVIFFDADCFPLRNPEFLFDTAEYREFGALFWPDTVSIKLGENGTVWKASGVSYQHDTEFESGLMVVDRQRCWPQLCLTDWMNMNSAFWYQHCNGDKDTFYIAWRKMGVPYGFGPPAKRCRGVLTRHFWFDGSPIAEHKCGAGKYLVPQFGRWNKYTAPNPRRSFWKNLYAEYVQRFLTTNFRLHASFLRELV